MHSSQNTEMDLDAVEEFVTEQLAEDIGVGPAQNIVGAVITVGVSLLVLLLFAMILSYFVDAIPVTGAYSEAINSTVDIGETAFIVLGVALLAVPVVAVVGYFYNSGLGGFMGR